MMGRTRIFGLTLLPAKDANDQKTPAKDSSKEEIPLDESPSKADEIPSKATALADDEQAAVVDDDDVMPELYEEDDDDFDDDDKYIMWSIGTPTP